MLLAQAGYKVTIIAEHYPGDSSMVYASPWYDCYHFLASVVLSYQCTNCERAGAHWRTSATSSEIELCDWDIQTYHWWVDIMNEERMRPSIPRSSLKVSSAMFAC